MNWKTILGIVFILVGVLLFVNVNHVNHIRNRKSYPLIAYSICSCPIIVGSLLMNKARKLKKKNK